MAYCYECPRFPCYKFRKFAASWLSLGQDLIQNQRDLENFGADTWLAKSNDYGQA